MKNIILMLSIFSVSLLHGQHPQKLCNYLYQHQLKKVEKIIHHQIEHQPISLSKGYPDFQSALNSVENWLSCFECVEEVFRDKCSIKLASYPGKSKIGVKYRIENQFIEICYNVQEGQIKMNKTNDKLIYLSAEKCTGFIEKEKLKCQ